MEKCVICNQSLENITEAVCLRSKGAEGINSASTIRGDELKVEPGQFVHKSCRCQYINPNKISSATKIKVGGHQEASLCTRSHERAFSFKSDCLFCGSPAKYSSKKRGHDVYPVRTEDFQVKIRDICSKRNDIWSEKVLARIEYVQDLHAADAVYHQTCSVNFRTNKSIPQNFTQGSGDNKRLKPGRHDDVHKKDAFLKVLGYLEEMEEDQVVTMQDLIKQMSHHLTDAESVYSFTYMKQQLLDYYGDNIIISEIKGKANIITLKRTASHILHGYYQNPRNSDPEEEKVRLLDAASKLIKSDIRSVDVSTASYPSYDELSDISGNLNLVPKSLVQILRALIPGKDKDLKIASIGQVIMQAARPRSLKPPIPLGLSIQLHHHFASRYLIDTLSSHGFCSSYSEVKKFEYSAAYSQGIDIPEVTPDNSLQFVADNVDHNTRTLDGFNSFHGMGIIATITPATRYMRPIPRGDITPEALTKLGKINLKFYKPPLTPPANLKYEQLQDFIASDDTESIDFLWKSVWLLKPSRPGWSGVMQTVQKGSYPGTSSVVFLPMIDLNPSDSTCIFSTLTFVSEQSSRYGKIPILTFDQPLWWKAMMIVSKEPSSSNLHSIILRLGGLHTEMSFLGCIGHLMAGSGLHELLEVVYAEKAVGHILTGKAIARSIRAHLLVDASLSSLLLAKAYDIQLHCESSKQSTDSDTTLEEEAIGHTDDRDLHNVTVLFDELLSDSTTQDEVNSSEALQNVRNRLDELKISMEKSRTAKLWFQYMEMVNILRSFIRGERTGNWKLHLKSMFKMLPYFAASGHNHYTKSVRLYLQMMDKLEDKQPKVYDMFQRGLHVVRRSDRYWAGLSTDLVIEQVLMRSMKTVGGLTRGTGMDETQRLVWLLSMPARAEITNAMQEMSKVETRSSEQHIDLTKARVERDSKDERKIINFLMERDPFEDDSTLRNIANGMTAHPFVNAEDAENIGWKIVNAMTDADVSEFSFKKSNQAITMNFTGHAKAEDTVTVDPMLLFQRLVTVAWDTSDKLNCMFKFELCTYPPSMFDSDVLLKQANKPVLANTIWDLMDKSDHKASVPDDVHHVIDGGSLIQRLPWPRGVTYGYLCDMYCQYIKTHYSTATVVFDGYKEQLSTKDIAHLRRTGGVTSATVRFEGNMVLYTKKESFLSNKANKQRFINLLSDQLLKEGVKTHQAREDADLLITQTAMSEAASAPTVVVGEDTDLLVLLCYHANLDSFDIFLRSDVTRNSKKESKTWDIIKTKNTLGKDTCTDLLFLHAIAGCDTTSRLHGIGKAVPLKKYKLNPDFRTNARTFHHAAIDVSHDDIAAAGEKALLCLYSGETGEDLNQVRYRRFREKVATSISHVHPQSLPPTSAAAKQHSLRVYLQVQQWKGVEELKPEDWGWKILNNKLFPQLTDLPPAPKDLLQVMYCNCKTTMCSSMRCSCRRHDLKCTSMCGDCRGVSCLNCTEVLEE